jgi:bifunctional non-homologous end joining protein LigD
MEELGAVKAPMQHEIRPMLAKIREEPFDSDEWLFEIKWDGYRAVAEAVRGEVELYSRNNLSFNHRYPAVVAALQKLNHTAVLDGEVVVPDDSGKPSFQQIQHYDPASGRPVLYYLYDILHLDGYDLSLLPLESRKEILRHLVPADDPVLKYSDHITGEGRLLYEEMARNDMEGIIAKERNSPYRQGVRSGEWLKIKAKRMQEAVIAGFTAPRGGRKNLGALILGVYEDGVLIYAGHTGGGFTAESLRETHRMLEPLIQDESPFSRKVKTNAPVTWVRPELVCQVEFSEWTHDGHMRHPIFQGMRVDKKPQEVVREQESSPPAEKKPKKKMRKATEEKDATVSINRHRLKLTNLDKVYWPEEKYTKGDVIAYYRKISGIILPYLKDRPESLHRHPNGITGESFYHKDAGGAAPSWVKTSRIESEEKHIHYIVCQDEASLIYLNNLGCIEINPWNSRVRSKDRPDYIVIDLDPSGGNTFEEVIETTLAVKEVLKKAGARGYCKTSGATGMHVYIPLEARYDYEEAKEFARIIAYLTHELVPDITTVERTVKSRGDKIYVDFLQNRRGQTLACAYSLRPKPGATVSTPLEWKEIKPGLHPSQFNINTIFKRLEKKGDLFSPVLGEGVDIIQCLKNLGA